MLGAMFASPYYLDPTLDPSSDPVEITQRVAASRKDMHERRKGYHGSGGDMKEGEAGSTPPSHSRRASTDRSSEEIAATMPLLSVRSTHDNAEEGHEDQLETIAEKRPTMHERRRSLDHHLAGGDAMLLHTPDKASSTSLFSHQLEMPYQLHSNDRKDEPFTHSPSGPSSSTASSLNLPSPSQSHSSQGREHGIVTNNNLPLVDLSSSAFTQLLSTGGKPLSKVCRQGFNSTQRQEVWPRILLYPSSVLSMDSSLYYRLVEIVFTLPRTSLTELIPSSEAEGFLDPELATQRLQQLQQSLPSVFPDAPSLGRISKFDWSKHAIERSPQSILAQRRILCVLASGLSSSTSQLAIDGAPSTRTLFYYAPQLPALLSIVFHVFACDEVKTFVYMQAMLERSQRDEKFLFLSPISERIFTSRIFDRMLKKFQPDLWKHFHEAQWNYCEWFQHHLQNLFLDSSLPIESILRCCDLVISNGISSFMKFAITLLGKFEMYLLSGEKDAELMEKKLDHLFKVVNMDSLFGANSNAAAIASGNVSTATTASSSAASSSSSSTSSSATTSPASLTRTITEAVTGGPATGWMSEQALFPHMELMKLSQQAEKDHPPMAFSKLQLERGTMPTVFHLPTRRGVGKVDDPQNEHILDVPLMYSLYDQAMEGHFPSNTHDPHLVFASWREGHSLRAMISAIQTEIASSTAPAAHSVLVLIQFEERDHRLRSLHLNTNDDDDGMEEGNETQTETRNKKIVALFFDKFPIGSWNSASQLNVDQEIEVNVEGRGFIATIGMTGTNDADEGELPIHIQQFEFPEAESVLDEVVADVMLHDATAVAAVFGETNESTIAEEGTPSENFPSDATGEHEVASPVPNSLPILPVEGGPASLQPSPATSPMDSSNAPFKESLKRRGSIAKILDALHLKRFDDTEEDEKKNDPNYELIKAALNQIPSLSPFKTAHIRVVDPVEAEHDQRSHGRHMSQLSSSSVDSRASSAPASPSQGLSSSKQALPLPLGSPGDSDQSLSSVKRIKSLFSFSTPTGKARSVDSPQQGGSVASSPASTRSINSSASNSRKSSIVAGLERVWSFIDSVPASTTMSVPSSKVPSPVPSRKGSVSSTPMHHNAGSYGGHPRLPPLNASSPMMNTTMSSAPGSALSSPSSRKSALPPAPFSTTSAAASHVALKLNQQRMTRGSLTSTNSKGRAPLFTRAATAAPTPQNQTPVRIRSMTSAGLGKNDQAEIQRHIESMRARERSWDSSAATLESVTRQRSRASSNVVQSLPESKEEVEARLSPPQETNDTVDGTQPQPPASVVEGKAVAASLAPMSASHAYLQSLSASPGTDSIVQTEAEQPKSDVLSSPAAQSPSAATPSVGALTAAFRASQNPLQLRLDDLEPDAQPSHIQSVREALTRSRRRSLIRSRTSSHASQTLLFDKEALLTESPTDDAAAAPMEPIDTEGGTLDDSALLQATPILSASAVFSNNAFILRIPSLKLLLSINSTLEEGLWQCAGMDDNDTTGNATVDASAASNAVDSSKSATTDALESEKKYECASIEAWNFR